MSNENINLPQLIIDSPKIDSETKDKNAQSIFVLRELADKIETVIKRWIYLRPEYYKVVATWIVGCYLHEKFSTYPQLFFNAMKGSGKTRTLNLIKVLTKGEMLISLKETNLFRHPEHKPLIIDEFEGVGSKDADNLRQVINSSYKKGGTVVRYKKERTATGENWVKEVLPAFKPMAMANIWGMDEVVGDRAITLVLEKTSDPYYSMKQEDFDDDAELNELSTKLNEHKCTWCTLVFQKYLRESWNTWVEKAYLPIKVDTLSALTTLTTLTTLSTLNSSEFESFTKEELDRNMFFEEINRTGIRGRDLELFFPLFIISNLLGDDWLQEMFKTAKVIVDDKKSNETIISKDIMLYEYISDQIFTTDFISLTQITQGFRQFALQDDSEDRWLNTHWVAKAIKRLNLVKKKRRSGNKGIEFVLDIEKAIEKMKMFKPEEKKNG